MGYIQRSTLDEDVGSAAPVTERLASARKVYSPLVHAQGFRAEVHQNPG